MSMPRPRPHALPRAVLFDAYGTLFDVHSVALLAEQLFPGQGERLRVILTAFAHYAQIDEGLSCDDEMYKITDADRMEYAEAIR